MTDYLAVEQKSTFTTSLLLPAVGMSKRSLVKYGFINGYLDDKTHDIHYKPAVYILFKPPSWDRFEAYLEIEQNTPNLISSYDYAGGYIVLVYSILERFIKDYELFMEGKYSKFSEEYKATFPKMVRHIDRKTGVEVSEVSLQYHIISKSEALKKMRERELGIKFEELGPDMEVWSKVDVNRETLDIAQIRLEIEEEDID
jgi:hypothetical protein